MNDIQHFPQDSTEESIDLRKWAGKILANWYWFVFSLIIFGGAAFLFTRYSVSKYHVESTLLVQENQKSAGGVALFQDMDLFGERKNIQNEIGMIKSWTMARRTLGELKNFEITYVAVGRIKESVLYDNIPFRVTPGSNTENIMGKRIDVTILSDTQYQIEMDGDPKINVKQEFNQPFEIGEFKYFISRNPFYKVNVSKGFDRSNKYYFVVNNLDWLAYEYQEKLGVDLTDKLSSMLNLSIEGLNSRQMVDYLNTLMTEYIQSSLELKNKTAANTVKFIEDQLSGIKDTLRLNEQSLQDFRSRNKVINISAEGQRIMEESNQIAQEKVRIDGQVNYYETLQNYLDRNDDFSKLMAPSTMGINDPMLTDLISTLVRLSTDKILLQYSAKEGNAALEMVNNQIKSIQASLSELVKNILQRSKQEQAEVNRRMMRLSGRIQDLPATERQLTTITRQFELSNTIYTYLLQKQAEAGITQASNVPDQMIIDRARADAAYKVFPRNALNYAIGLFLGLIFPILILILKDFLSFTIEEKSDIEKYTNVPIIGTVGHNKHENLIPVINHTRSSVTESFRAIRTNLQFSLYGEGKEVVMVTSSTSGEGKSFLAMNLAGIYSVTGKSAVVVGLDLRKPMTHKYFDVENKVGVSTYLIGKSSLLEIIVPSEYPNLSIIPSGPIPPNPAELIELPRFAQFIAELRAAFDIVILDTPPVALVTDAMLISQYADATLYVVRQKYTRKTSLAFIEDLKGREHVKNLSIVINDVMVPKYYGYKYGYGYGYGYGKGYGSGYYTDDK